MTDITIKATYDELETTYDEILEALIELGFEGIDIKESEK